MEKALRILDDAIKALESEVRIWTKQGDLDIVEKCKNEIKQCAEAIEKLRGGECSNENSGLHLQRVRRSYFIKLRETTKAYPKVTYYTGLIDEILQDTKKMREATLMQSKDMAKAICTEIEALFDYTCEICEY